MGNTRENIVNLLQENPLTIDSYLCNSPNGKIRSLVCDVKYLHQGNLKVDVHGNLSETVHDAWVNAVFYYKYDTYQKYAINLWENLCDWFSGKTQSHILDWTIGRVQRFTNVNHTCPYYEGYKYIQIDNISMEAFPLEPLMTAGRYRIDLSLTGENRSNVYFLGKLFISVSDSGTHINEDSLLSK